MTETFDREAALQRYQDLLSERASLANNIKWLRSQLPSAHDDADEPEGSDLLFLADYARLERHVQIGAGRGPKAEPTLELSVRQRMEKMSTVLWPSGCVLAEVVALELRDMCSRGADILELGCGTAVPSITAAALGANVLATDLDVSSADLVIAANNVALSAAGGSIATACLRWGAPVPDRPWAAVLVADGIYDENGHTDLATTLASAVPVAFAAGATEAPRILVAYQLRRPAVEGRFLRAKLPQVGLLATELPLEHLSLSENLRSYIRVLEVTRLEVATASLGDRAARPAPHEPEGLYL